MKVIALLMFNLLSHVHLTPFSFKVSGHCEYLHARLAAKHACQDLCTTGVSRWKVETIDYYFSEGVCVGDGLVRCRCKPEKKLNKQ